MAKELKIRITGDNSGLRKATDESVGVLEGFGQKIGAFSVAAGTLLADGIKAGFGAAVGFLGDSLGAAVDMNETVSKVGVLFGDASQAVQDFAAASATEFGQSKQQALDAAATFATFGKAAGLGGDQLADFSTGFVGLASDLASFNNTSPEEAVQAIGAALRGEAEPMRRFGVLLDDATLRQKALELGIVSTTKDALTPQQKVLAAQAAIWEQTSSAQGDFARTSGGLANQQRILAANVDNLKARLGQGLLPIALRLTSWVNTALIPAVSRWVDDYGPAIEQSFARLAGWVQNVVTVFEAGGWQAALGEVGGKLKDLWLNYMDWLYTTALPAIGAALLELGRKLGTWVTETGWPWLVEHLGIWLGLFGEWFTGTALPWLGEQAQQLSDRLAGWVADSAAKLRENLPIWLGEFAEWATGTALPALAEKTAEFAVKLAKWVIEAGEQLRRNLPIWLARFTVWVTTDAIPAMAQFGYDIAEAVNDALMSALGFAADIGWEIVTGIISGLWDSAGRLNSAVAEFVASNIPGPVRDLLGLGGGSGGYGTQAARSSSPAGGFTTMRAPALPELNASGGFTSATLTSVVMLDGRQLAIATAPYTRQLERARQ
jgi:hypothetical protein